MVQYAPPRGGELPPDGVVELVSHRAMDQASAERAFQISPAVASEIYFPEVFGRSDGRLLTIAGGE